MDLLESVLRTCSAENYVANFKNQGIDSYTLKILNEEDLLILGISDTEIRTNILAHTANLQIRAEKKIDPTVDKQHVLLILNQMSVHVNKHYANLSYALKRSDTDLCPINVTPALECLQQSLKSFDSELIKIENRFITKKKTKLKPYFLVSTIGITAAILFGFMKYVKFDI